MIERTADLLKEIEALEKALKQGDVSCYEHFRGKHVECKALAFIEGQSRCAAGLAKIYLMKNEALKGMHVIQEVYEQTSQLEDRTCFALMNNALGSLYAALDDNIQANKHYLIALEEYSKLNLLREKASVLANLGVYFGQNQKNQDKALEYLTKAWDILKNIEDKENWVILHSLGQYYRRNQQEGLAAKYFQESLELAQKYKHPFGLSMGYSAIARQAEAQGNIAEALRNLNLALQIEEDQNTQLFRNHNYVYKAKYLFLLGETEEALALTQDLVKTAKKPRIRVDAYALLSEIYESQKDYKRALEAHKKHEQHKHEFINLESKKHIETTEARFQNKVKETEKELLRLQKFETEQKAIRAQLNPHFIFNSLNSINKFILSHDIDKASSFLQRFSSLMRKTLEHSELGFISLDEECSFLNEYLLLEQMRFNNAFRYQITIDEEIESDFVRIPTMLIQPYVENCVKHAMVGLVNGQISIHFKHGDNDSLRCIVEDNGKKKGVKTNENHHSMSTNLLENRLHVLKELYKVDFKVKSIKRSNIDPKQTGTRVEIDLYTN